MNLTGLSTREKVVIELFLDSLIPAPFLPAEGRMLDVGSGAGFPGLPIKIYSPKLRTQLLEPSRKKINFLRQVIRLLNLSAVEAVRGRIENNVSSLSVGSYDIVTARAVAASSRTIPWCAPYLAPGGQLVAFFGRGVEKACRESRSILKRYDLVLQRRIPYRLPGKRSERTALIFRKKAANE